MSETYGIKVTYGALPQAIMDARRNPALVRRAQTEAIAAAMPYLWRKLGTATPQGAFGFAGKHVTVELDPAGPVGHVGYAEPASGYMRFVEDGTRPHWPPLKAPDGGPGPMQVYAARKFGYPVSSPEAKSAGYLIARKISRVGTSAQHVVEKVANENRVAAQKLMARAAIGVFRSFGSTK